MVKVSTYRKFQSIFPLKMKKLKLNDWFNCSITNSRAWSKSHFQSYIKLSISNKLQEKNCYTISVFFSSLTNTFWQLQEKKPKVINQYASPEINPNIAKWGSSSSFLNRSKNSSLYFVILIKKHLQNFLLALKL